jgi:hypothetical protein
MVESNTVTIENWVITLQYPAIGDFLRRSIVSDDAESLSLHPTIGINAAVCNLRLATIMAGEHGHALRMAGTELGAVSAFSVARGRAFYVAHARRGRRFTDVRLLENV